jgi:hypothetical protein
MPAASRQADRDKKQKTKSKQQKQQVCQQQQDASLSAYSTLFGWVLGANLNTSLCCLLLLHVYIS